jgi:hypothetical protein
MYFGLIKVPTYFMDLTDKVFMEYLDKFIIVFINDVLVYSEDEEEHEEHIHLVLKKLQNHRLYAKLSKCELHEASAFLESHHFGRRNNHGFKQDSRYVNFEYIR